MEGLLKFEDFSLCLTFLYLGSLFENIMGIFPVDRV